MAREEELGSLPEHIVKRSISFKEEREIKRTSIVGIGKIESKKKRNARVRRSEKNLYPSWGSVHLEPFNEKGGLANAQVNNVKMNEVRKKRERVLFVGSTWSWRVGSMKTPRLGLPFHVTEAVTTLEGGRENPQEYSSRKNLNNK